jgi:hypothetical protein
MNLALWIAAALLAFVALGGGAVKCWGAMVTHLRLREPGFAALNVGYLALAAFVAWGRLWPEQFPA